MITLIYFVRQPTVQTTYNILCKLPTPRPLKNNEIVAIAPTSFFSMPLINYMSMVIVNIGTVGIVLFKYYVLLFSPSGCGPVIVPPPPEHRRWSVVVVMLSGRN